MFRLIYSVLSTFSVLVNTVQQFLVEYLQPSLRALTESATLLDLIKKKVIDARNFNNSDNLCSRKLQETKERVN